MFDTRLFPHQSTHHLKGTIKEKGLMESLAETLSMFIYHGSLMPKKIEM